MLKRVQISGFKSLVDVKIDLDPLTVLIGRSGSGKTNVVEAIRLLRDFISDRGFNRFQPQEWLRICPAGQKNPVISFEVTFSVEGVDEDFVYLLSMGWSPHMPLGGHHPALRKERLRLGVTDVFHQRLDGTQFRWIVPPHLASVPDPGLLMLGVLYGISEARIAHLMLTKGLGCYDFPGDVLKAVGQSPSDKDAGFQDKGENFLATFDRMSSDLSDLVTMREIVAAMAQINPSIQSIEADPVQKNRILVGHQFGQGPTMVLDLSQQSEGLRRFLAHLLALYQSPSKPTMIFEEPEKGIFPGALGALADYFKAVVADFEAV